MKIETILKSTLVILSLVAFASVADEQIDNPESNGAAAKNFFVKVNPKANTVEFYTFDKDDAALKNLNGLSESDKAAFTKKLESEGVKIATQSLSEKDSTESTENWWYRGWRWGGWGWRGGYCGYPYYGGYYGYYRPYYGGYGCGYGYPYYGGINYGYMGGYGYGGCGYYGYGAGYVY